MAGPLHSIIYIHNAIHKEVNEFEEAARELNREDGTQVAALLDRFKFFREVLKEHEGGEEEFIFPVLEERFRYIAGPYIFDHQQHYGEYDDIEESLTGLRTARGNAERVELAQRLNRQAIALAVTMDIHITKENELLLPVVDEHLSVEEQQAMLGQAMGNVPPEFMMKVLPWMFRAQTGGDREGFLREGMEMFPPEQLGGIVRRIPELKAYGG